MAWWRKGWIGVLGSLFALAACSSDSSPSTTVALPSASTTRPAGFGGTLPAVTTSSVVVTTLLATTTAVSTTPVSTTDEAALRTRVLEYDRAFREELLHMPNPNYDRLRSFYLPSVRSEVLFDGIRNEASEQHSYRLNDPDVYRATVQRVSLRGEQARAVLCAEDNIVAMGPGPDRMALTTDDVVTGSLLSTTQHTEDWIAIGGRWMIEDTVSYENLGQGAQCG